MAIITRDEYKALAQVTTDEKDSVIDALIPVIESDYLRIRGKAFEQSGDRVVYPNGSTLTAKLMLDWQLSPERGKLSSGIKSEKIGDYSYQLGEIDSESGYPASVIGNIEQYVSVKLWE